MIITKQALKEIDDYGWVLTPIDANSIEKATKFVAGGFGDDGGYVSKTLTAPKTKEVTLDWLKSKLFAERKPATDIYPLLRQIFGTKAASYGVGVDTLWKAEEKKAEVRSLLDKYGIQYREECSFGGWTYKFVISKSKENVANIERAIKEEAK